MNATTNERTKKNERILNNFNAIPIFVLSSSLAWPASQHRNLISCRLLLCELLCGGDDDDGKVDVACVIFIFNRKTEDTRMRKVFDETRKQTWIHSDSRIIYNSTPMRESTGEATTVVRILYGIAPHFFLSFLDSLCVSTAESAEHWHELSVECGKVHTTHFAHFIYISHSLYVGRRLRATSFIHSTLDARTTQFLLIFYDFLTAAKLNNNLLLPASQRSPLFSMP